MIERFYEAEETSDYVQKAYTYGIPVMKHGENDIFKKQVDCIHDRYLEFKKKNEQSDNSIENVNTLMNLNLEQEARKNDSIMNKTITSNDDETSTGVRIQSQSPESEYQPTEDTHNDQKQKQVRRLTVKKKKSKNLIQITNERKDWKIRMPNKINNVNTDPIYNEMKKMNLEQKKTAIRFGLEYVTLKKQPQPVNKFIAK